MKNLTYVGIGTGSATTLILVILFINTPNSVEDENDIQKIYEYSLNLVNEDRKNHGFTELALGDNGAAQIRADDMLKNKYFSHWSSEKTKPYVAYSKTGGKGLVIENIAQTEWRCTGNCMLGLSDMLGEITLHEKNMVYDDAHVNWSHRDTILDPYVTKVNFGISYNDEYLYFVQHFERNLIEWDNISLETDGTLLLSGSMSPKFTLDKIFIYKDPEPIRLTSDELNSEKPYSNPYYDSGMLAGIIVHESESQRYNECEDGKLVIETEFDKNLCISYKTYSNKSLEENEIDISIDVSDWLNQNGVHTMYVQIYDINNDRMVEATSLTLEYLN